MRRNIEYEKQTRARKDEELYEGDDYADYEEDYSDSFLEKLSQKFKNRKVPAYKKAPIHCDNIEVSSFDFTEEDYVCVLKVEGVQPDAENESVG